MARARNIKPGFFKNEVLAELHCETRLLFIGLWTLADREGRLEDRPRRIKMELFAYDSFDVDSMLAELQSNKFVHRYEVDGTKYIQIENFVKHQDPHYREKASEIPHAPGFENKIVATGVTRTQRARILERDGYKCQACGSIDQSCIDHVVPVSRGGDSSDDNLQVLCLSCNTKKGNKLESTSIQRRVDVDSNNELNARLIPDSLIPDSLIPDSLIPDSLIPDSLIPDSLIPESLISDSKPTAQKPRLDYQLDAFDDFWATYPNRPGSSKADSLKAWKARIKEGANPADMIDGAAKYSAYCVATSTEPKYIKQPVTFLGVGKHYASDWTPPKPSQQITSWQDKKQAADDATAAVLYGTRQERIIEGVTLCE